MATVKIDIAPNAKILAVDLAFIGDLLMTTPALAGLRRAFPSATIDILVSPGSAPVIERNPSINNIISTSMKRGGLDAVKKEAARIAEAKYDLAISLHRGHGTLLMLKLAGIPRRIGFTNGGRGLFLSGGTSFDLYKHRSWNNLRLLEKGLGIDVDYSTRTSLILDPEATINIEQRLAELPASKGIVAINPNAAWATKRWLPERFAEVADQVSSRGYTPIIIGGPKETGIAEKVKASMKSTPIDFTGQTSLKELAALLAKSKTIVTNDSGPMHIAQAVGIPVISIFGPTDPARCGPWTGTILPIQAKIDCIKCYRKTCWHLTCMRQVSAADIAEPLADCLD